MTKKKSPRKGKKGPTKASPTSTESKIRIIAGQWRGRKLPVLQVDGLRPTGDRIKETLFNWLQTDIHGARCLDLFAGTGSLGLEALSRGAAFTQFIEFNPMAARQLGSNLSVLAAQSQGNVLQTSALTWLENTPDEAFNIVFIDPPFQGDLWQAVIERIQQPGWLAADSLVYIETPKGHPLEVPTGWSVHKQKQTGQICATLYAPN